MKASKNTKISKMPVKVQPQVPMKIQKVPMKVLPIKMPLKSSLKRGKRLTAREIEAMLAKWQVKNEICRK